MKQTSMLLSITATIYPKVIDPCSTHDADQPVGVTCTLILRPHREQYLGGSMRLARSQAA